MASDLSLSTRVIVINGLLFAAGTAVLALSPATVSSQPVLSESVVLLVGLAVMIVANSVLVRRALRPLERLRHQLTSAASAAPEERVAVPASGVTRPVSVAVNDLLERIDDAQRASAAAALAAQESERSRIAQELHDGVGQSLTAVLLELKLLSESAPSPSLDRVRDGVRASLDEVRSVARTLRPHVLEDLGLRSALAALTQDLFGSTRTHVRRGIMPGLPDLPADVELVVFRVAQEALTNVARHAEATTVELSLGMVGREIELRVTDDGHGLPRGAEGTGLRGMRERAALVGGRIDVARRDGGGTVAALRVPVAAP
ncbi:sensor histidine kinase [Nocardioides currus]|uniref:histidine kinase n=1 Tax=Nocardioides currus TaxID=2133958 RepID=A0A2R7YUN6_9ACTN|nr:sensor histidine kinase [Nocardioides currus]PUA80051.1 sensor histidine kinase [Nocardioides currus]